ncbi:MAG TPA: hypothetical protein PLS77_07410 [Anaerolineaceae bacterium]|jgi:hypothetical protein|nr:hypothetical protein [Chloroflexota bacterium]HOU44241.1 hypothetical protein [Anaerolineaceae bacterium]HPA32404.1 hypothetical protein [Anaerolineaceae bacterium]HQF45511.1 hypothetical protein [Anaerolineaceae bacterium]HQH35524.1 hypothetical protein [Anaerolineaceae bacterium]
MDWKELAIDLAKKLTAPMAFGILLIVALGVWGDTIPPAYQLLIYIVVIGAFVLYSVVVVLQAIPKHRTGQDSNPETPPDNPPQ